jgi:hypothetical protein
MMAHLIRRLGGLVSDFRQFGVFAFAVRVTPPTKLLPIAGGIVVRRGGPEYQRAPGIASKGGLAVRPRAFIGSANDGLQGSNRGSLAGAFSARRSPSFGSEVETFTERHAGSQALHRRGHAGPERIMVGEPIQSSRLPT